MKATEQYLIPLVLFSICYTAVPNFKSGWNGNDVSDKKATQGRLVLALCSIDVKLFELKEISTLYRKS